ncbi:MAG: SPFH domain-containing protein [Aquihabitans sp.]
MNPLVIAGLGLAVLAVALVILVVSRIRVAGPNEAFVITGRKGKAGGNDTSGQKVVMGASVFVVPFVQKLGVMNLSSRQIAVSVPAAVSANGIRCTLEGVAVVKVGGTEELIRAAAQRFLGQQTEIDVFTREVLAGSLRAIVGRLSVEEIIRDRARFAGAVAEEAENSLTNQGLVLDTFQLQDIQAEGSYLLDLGRPEAARAEKEAAIAEAIARREAEQARISAEEMIAIANRELQLKQAEIKAETDAAAANAAAAGPLSQAAKDQEVIAAQEQVAARQAALKEQVLDAEVRKPADAQRYAVEQEAEANRSREISEAQAAAETTRLSGAAERERRTALAEATKAEGLAEADAIRAKGEATAEAMRKKAGAYKEYGDAAVVDIMAEALPKIVAEAAKPMASIGSMTVVSTDGSSQLVRSVSSTVAQSQALAKSLLGIDLSELVQGFVNSKSTEGDEPVLETSAAAETSTPPTD